MTTSRRPTRLKDPSPIWQSRRLAYAVLILAIALRLLLLAWPPFYTGIEDIHTPSSMNYVETGHFDPDNDYSGPFRKILQYPTLKSLGDTAVARRLPNAVFGGLTAFFLVLLGQQLFPGRRIGGLAGLFLATDPFHVSFSRTTWEEIPAALFITAGLYFLAKARAQTQPDRYLMALVQAGAALSLALATRRYVALLLVGVVAWLIYHELKGPISVRGSSFWRRAAFLAAVFGLAPLIAYTLTFYPWFTRGYSLPEWLLFQKHMIVMEIGGVPPQLSDFAKFYGGSYRAADWFTKTVVFGYRLPVDDTTTATLMIINNPFSWLLIWPSLIALIAWGRRALWPQAAFVVVAFLLLYLPFLVAGRQILIYSALAVLPLAFLLLAAALDLALTHEKKIISSCGAMLIALILISNLVFYPLAVAMPLPNEWSDLAPYASKLMEPDRPITNQ